MPAANEPRRMTREQFSHYMKTGVKPDAAETGAVTLGLLRHYLADLPYDLPLVILDSGRGCTEDDIKDCFRVMLRPNDAGMDENTPLYEPPPAGEATEQDRSMSPALAVGLPHAAAPALDGEAFETPTVKAKSEAAYQVMLYGTEASLSPHTRLAKTRERLEELPAEPARVGNPCYRPDGYLYTCADGSRVLQAYPRNDVDDNHFGLIRFAGDFEPGRTVYVDFTYHPPLATTRTPLPGAWSPPKDIIEVEGKQFGT